MITIKTIKMFNSWIQDPVKQEKISAALKVLQEKEAVVNRIEKDFELSTITMKEKRWGEYTDAQDAVQVARKAYNDALAM